MTRDQKCRAAVLTRRRAARRAVHPTDVSSRSSCSAPSLSSAAGRTPGPPPPNGRQPSAALRAGRTGAGRTGAGRSGAGRPGAGRTGVERADVDRGDGTERTANLDGTYSHVPVMLDEVLELGDGLPDGVVVDATLGGAGHAAALLDAHPGWALVGIDRDPDAIAAASARLDRFAGRVSVHRARFDEIGGVVAASPFAERPVVAVLFDLGVSSHQLDVAARGFSYRSDGPLDMRMDPNGPRRAADLVNELDERSLEELFVANGEGRLARRIARAVVADRPYESTRHLADVVVAAVPVAARRRGHPARRVFQALRIAVNDELEILGPALDDAVDLLAPRGRLVVLAYHSGEDRIVKQHLRTAETGGCICPPSLPCVCGAVPVVRLLNRGARLASSAEIAVNPRAESVRLRAAERLDSSAPGARGTR